MALFSKSSFCVVTGASRGLGREIAVQLAKEWSQAGVQSDIVITATNRTALEETKTLLNTQAPEIGVHIVPGDLADSASLPALCSEILAHLDTKKHQQCLLVNNAGTMSSFEPFLEQSDPETLKHYMDVNLTSKIVLTLRFLSACAGMPQYVIQITSLLGTMFLPGFAMYSVSRAARNAFIGVLAAEQPNTRLLSYSPGPCDTDMLRSIPEEIQIKGVQPLTTEESISKLMVLLREDKYKNASVVDYYDCV